MSVLAALALMACQSTTQTNPATASAEPSAQAPAANPFLTPGVCRAVYIQTPDKQAALAELQRVTTINKSQGASMGVYLTTSGDYIGARTMDLYFKNPAAFRKNHDRRAAAASIAYSAKEGRYHPTARCSDGSEIVAETGLWHGTPHAIDPNGGIVGAALTAGLGVIENARTPVAPSSGGDACFPVSSDVIAGDTTADNLVLSGPDTVTIDNAGRSSTRIVCRIGSNPTAGTYRYAIEFRDRTCTGQVQLPGGRPARIAIFGDCALSYVN